MRRIFFLFIVLAFGCISNEPKPDSKPTSPTLKQIKKTYSTGLVSADNQFKGALLNDFKKLNDSLYQAFIAPENTPVNNSPWYCFRLWSEEKKNITCEIDYDAGYKNRYIPKISTDGVSWKPLSDSLYQVDTLSGKIQMQLSLSPEKLWISAQENLNSDFVNNWVNSLTKINYISKEVIGKSVLGQNIDLLKIKNGNPRHAIILIGRQHPPEVPGSTISLMSFVNTILSDSELAKKFTEKFEVILFPLLNPDGVDHGFWRHNANGKDLNRDWVAFSQPETIAVKNWVEKSMEKEIDKTYCFGIDFHTSYSGPYLLTLDTIPHKIKPDITSEWISQIETETNRSLDIRPRAQTLPYCYNWMINQVGIEAVTYEEGDEIDRTEVKKRAETYANTLMEILLSKYY